MNRLEFYTDEELKTIILRSAKVLDVEIEEEGALELARRSRGTPRLANRLLKRVRDFAQVKYDGKITKKVADYALDLLDVDKYGLDHIDRSILLTMIEKFQAVLSVLILLRRRSLKMRGPWRMYMSRIC